mmetsp:Transcript_6053/g.13173  ORF Transcript_6053/g.13173 Transcript_6053/m.13173 type:complete len:299 (+) Transcript_6053:125-1021(+)
MRPRLQQLDVSPSCSPRSLAVCAPSARFSSWSLRQRSQTTTARLPCKALVLNVVNANSESFKDEDDYPLEIPTKFELMQRPDKLKPLVRVRLSVHYRVHSRQMLCIGGSQIPLGWSFLSIAKVPMTWNNGDIWTCEVELQAGQRIEYKYVILEEQDWTKLENEDAQGLVEITYRTGSEPGRPPDVQVIQKQMAIVAWQPGPNRVLQVPTEGELQQLRQGETIERIPARPQQRLPYESTGKTSRSPPPVKPDPFEGTWEVLTTDEEGRPFLDRHDVWGWVPSPGARPTNNLKGFNFGQQ